MDIEYTSLQNMAAQWNMSKRRIQVLCKEGRFPEAKMIGNMWVLPKETAKPMDARTKNPIAGNNEKHENIRTALKNLLKKCIASTMIARIKKCNGIPCWVCLQVH